MAVDRTLALTSPSLSDAGLRVAVRRVAAARFCGVVRRLVAVFFVVLMVPSIRAAISCRVIEISAPRLDSHATT